MDNQSKVGILTVSDRGAAGVYEDGSGPVIQQLVLKNLNTSVEVTAIIPDNVEKIKDTLLQWVDVDKLNLILTTGGTGFAPRDVTPEATRQVIDRETPGLVFAMLRDSLAVTPHAMLSRMVAGIRKQTLIINLPGSPKGAKENLGFYFLGNPPGVARRASDAIKEKIPEIQIGSQHGYLNLAAGNPENEAVIEKINTSGAQILLVGLGMPAQEKWLRENWPRLEVNIGITCGALFEYISGDLPRGPRWMTENYLEWFWRMITAPRRYTRRYFRDIPLFAYRIVNQKCHVRK